MFSNFSGMGPEKWLFSMFLFQGDISKLTTFEELSLLKNVTFCERKKHYKSRRGRS